MAKAIPKYELKGKLLKNVAGWAGSRTPAQRRIAKRLAKQIRELGTLSTGMLKGFAKLGLVRSYNLETIIRMGQLPEATNREIIARTLAILDSAATEKAAVEIALKAEGAF